MENIRGTRYSNNRISHMRTFFIRDIILNYFVDIIIKRELLNKDIMIYFIILSQFYLQRVAHNFSLSDN